MKQRPLLFLILGILHFFEPLIKIVSFKLSKDFPFSIVMNNILSMDGFENIFKFWILFPLGGMALLTIKKWTYPLFFAVQIYSIYSVLTYEPYTWPYVDKTPHFSAFVILAFNICVMVYFLIPSVRKPFFDKSVRWWEVKARFSIKIPATVSLLKMRATRPCTILNISQSGAFIQGPKEIFDQDVININFQLYEKNFSFLGEVMNKRFTDDGSIGYGIKFCYSNFFEHIGIKLLVSKLNRSLRRMERYSDDIEVVTKP